MMWPTVMKNGWLTEGCTKIKKKKRQENGDDDVIQQVTAISKSQHRTEDKVKASLLKTLPRGNIFLLSHCCFCCVYSWLVGGR